MPRPWVRELPAPESATSKIAAAPETAAAKRLSLAKTAVLARLVREVQVIAAIIEPGVVLPLALAARLPAFIVVETRDIALPVGKHILLGLMVLKLLLP